MAPSPPPVRRIARALLLLVALAAIAGALGVSSTATAAEPGAVPVSAAVVSIEGGEEPTSAEQAVQPPEDLVGGLLDGVLGVVDGLLGTVRSLLGPVLGGSPLGGLL